MMKKIRKLTTAIICAISLLAAAAAVHGQGQFQGVELTIVPVAGNVYMVSRPGGGGNIGKSVV